MTKFTSNIISTYILQKECLFTLLRGIIDDAGGVLEVRKITAITLNGVRSIKRIKDVDGLLTFESEKGETFAKWEVLNATDITIDILRNYE